MTFRLFFGLLFTLLTPLFSWGIEVDGYEKYSFKGPEVDLLFDRDHEYNINNIDSANFIEDNKRALSFGFYKGCLWLKFDLISKDSSERILEFKNTLIDDAILYSFVDNKWTKIGRVGDIHAFSTRTNPHRYLHMGISPNGQYLLKIEGRGDPLSLKMSLFTTEGLFKRDYSRQIISGLYLSILFIILLVNLFIFLFFREKRNFYLLIYLVCMMIYQITLVGYGPQLFWGEFPYIQNRIAMWAGCICIILLCLFLQTFINLSKTSPKINKAIVFFQVLLVVNILTSFSGNTDLLYFSHVLVNTISLIVIILLLTASIIAYRKNFESAAYVIFAKFAVIITLFVFVLNNFGLLPEFFLADISLEIGIAIQVIFLTLAVISSFQLYENESLEYLQKMADIRLLHNKSLALNIHDRTRKIEKQKLQLETTNSEIISSIVYSKRIQNALMPIESSFLDDFHDGFIINQPKELISGDFYWRTMVQSKNQNGSDTNLEIIFIGDTNQFGVPGALLGILYMRILQTAVRQDDIQTAAGVLEHIKSELNTTLNKTQKGTKHKLTCSICIIDKSESSLVYSGAHSSILHVSDGQVFETKGNKEFIDTKDDGEAFKNIKLNLKPHDTLIIYTDGIQKLCKNINEETSLKTLIGNDFTSDLTFQKKILENKIAKLLDTHEQEDDITIIAITC